MTPGKDPLTSATGREGQTFRGQGLLLRHANLVRLPHTIFALPFALVGVVLASYICLPKPRGFVRVHMLWG